ncbi:MAG: hypothetical protein AMXMBFR61_13140 [Fimbriimonadales bacterium]
MRHLLVTCSVAASALTTVSALQPFTYGNILVCGNGQVFEYTRQGQLVQTIGVPQAPGGDGEPRGIAVTSSGDLVVYNGTFQAAISHLRMSTGTWTHYLVPGLSTVNNVTMGKVTTFGNYVFATDCSTYGGGEANGLVRLDLSDGTWTRFGPADNSIDVVAGQDGLLYALWGSGSPSGTVIRSFDPWTLSGVQTFSPPNPTYTNRSIAVDAAGNIYVSQLYGGVMKLSPSMQLLASYNVSGWSTDVRISDDGVVMLMAEGGTVLLDAELNHIRTFANDGSFGTFVSVPEPSALATLAAGLVVLLQAKRRRL